MKRLPQILAALFGLILSVSAPPSVSAEEPIFDPLAYPAEQLQKDWMQQDSGACDVSNCFTSSESSDREQKMILKVFDDLQKRIPAAALSAETLKPFENRFETLKQAKTPGNDSAWKTLYFDLCLLRRCARLEKLTAKTNVILYTKHCLIAAPGNISSNHHPSDVRTEYGKFPEQRYRTWVPGSDLCRLTLFPDGTARSERLLHTDSGFIRDPVLSFDAKTLAFAMRDNFRTDDYDIFLMDLDSENVTQITQALSEDGINYPISTLYPCFLPNGRLLFQSTRCGQLDPCGWDQTGTFYTCRRDGSDIQRITCDQVTTMSPCVLEDGRVLYTRWEYNDRTPIYVQPLFFMNEDGTAQSEFYGNDSWFPTSILHARGIPGSPKIMAVASGHHVLQKGKLILIDRTKGTEEESGVEFIAGSAPDGTPGRKFPDPFEKRPGLQLDGFGQSGPQFAHPFPFAENNFLVSFTPDGYQGFGIYGAKDPNVPDTLGQPFGLYWMDDLGNRELLAFDPSTCCVEATPVLVRPVPPSRGSVINNSQNYGTFYVQNVYLGPGLEGVPVGTVKKLRVIGLQYRAAWVGSNRNCGPGGDSCVQCPIGADNACWDVKHVLGEVEVEPDGSACFQVPARQPVYFQAIDAQGHCVQTMRSWTFLLPGEQFSCLGCHEDKNQTGLTLQTKATLAMKKPVQELQPFAGVEHPFVKKLKTENLYDSVENYLGINAVDSWDPQVPTAGFSFSQRVQPILNRHCVVCHSPNAEEKASETVKPSAFDLTDALVKDERAARWFSRSYLTLTRNGQLTPQLNWVEAESAPPMLKPYQYGSGNSTLGNYLEPSHYGVRLTQNEKDTISGWVDLGVPFCGSYTQSNAWTDELKNIYEHYQKKRWIYARQELDALQKPQEKEFQQPQE